MLNYDVCNDMTCKINFLLVFIDRYTHRFNLQRNYDMVSLMRIDFYELKCVIDHINNVFEIYMIRK